MESWSIAFWFQLSLALKLAGEKGVIASYQGITVFLTLDTHFIGINDGKADYLGPKIAGPEKAPWVFFVLTKDASKVTLYLNAVTAIEIAHGEVLSRLEEFDAVVGDKSHIEVIEHDLSNWIEKRDLMFKSKRETSETYRLLPQAEQVGQLGRRIQALEALLHAFHGGQTYFFEDILANLRSLVFYRSKNQNYDPLLLRVAAFKKRSLPVYIMPGGVETRNLLLEASPVVAEISLARFEPAVPCVEMTDFQDFLEKPALFYHGQLVSPLDLIEKAATTQSAAHFDQKSPVVIEGLKDTPVLLGKNILEHHILDLAELVVRLGYYVLSAA